MRKIITLLIIASSIYLCSPTIFADEKYDFRKARWGMTRDEVKASESNIMIYSGEEDVISYHCKPAGMESGLLYIFTKGRLVKAGYVFQEEHTNLNNHISDFEKIKKILTQKYGLPVKHDQQWYNDSLKDSLSDWGFAVSKGHLKYSSYWRTETTKISLILQGKNYKIIHGVSFQSRKPIHLEEEEEQKNAQEDF